MKQNRNFNDLVNEHITSEKDVGILLQATLEDYSITGDKSEFLAGLKLASQCLENIKGISGLAKKTGINRQHLYDMLSPKGNPSFINIAKITKALGYEITIKQHK